MHAGGIDAVLNRVISSLLKYHATVHINFRPVRVWSTFYECKSLLHDLETLQKVYMVKYKYNITFSLGVCGKSIHSVYFPTYTKVSGYIVYIYFSFLFFSKKALERTPFLVSFLTSADEK